MARLPTPGGDEDTWGDVLNEFLAQAHNADGTLKDSAIGGLQGTPVSSTTPTDNNVLAFNSTSGEWEPVNPGTTTVPDADASTKGIVQLTGDLGGTAALPTVPGLAGKVDKSTVTTKGDLLAASGNSALDRLGVGSDGDILTVDSGQTLGIKWSAAASTSGNGPVLLVAASNAPAEIQSQADYTCDGTSDQDTINTAMNTFYTDSMKGGTVLLSAGTFTVDGAIKVPIRTALVGQGRATILKAADNATWAHGTDVAAATGAIIEPYDLNTSRTKVSNLEIRGNMSGSANVSGIWYKTNGSSGSATTPQFSTSGNEGPDAIHWFSDIYINQTQRTAFHIGSGRANQLYNIRVFNIGSSGTSSHGFDIDSADCFFTNCDAGACYGEGWNISGSNNHFTNCKGWYAKLNGFNVSGVRNMFSSCAAQDNVRHGFYLPVGPTTLSSCQADSNSYDGSPSGSMTGDNTYDGFNIPFSEGVQLFSCAAYDKNEDARGYRQRYGFHMGSSSTRNFILGTGSHNVSGLYGGPGTTASDNFIFMADDVDESMLKLTSGRAVLPMPTTQPADGDFPNSTLGFWIDEANRVLSIRARLSDGSYSTARTKLGALRNFNHLPVVAAASATSEQQNAADFECDGANDEVQINAALALGYGGCQLTGGVFTIAAPIVMGKEGVSLKGVGVGNDPGLTPWGGSTRIALASGFSGTAAIKVQDSAGTPTVLEPSVTLRDFQLHGGDFGSSVTGVLWAGSEGVMENVQVRNMSGHGIVLQGYSGSPSYGARFNNVIVTSCTGAAFRLDTYSGEATFANCHARTNNIGWHFVQGHGYNCSLNDCWAYNSTTHGMHFEGGGSYAKITNTKVEENGSHGIFFDNATAGVSGVQISNSSFDSNGRTTTNTYDHICTQGTSGGATSGLSVANCRFGNTYGRSNVCRYAVNLNSGVTYASVQGCNLGTGTAASAGASTSAVNFDSNARATSIFRSNIGHVTENGGTASVASGGNIAHGLVRTPTRYTVTPTVSGRVAVVTSVGGTNLSISLQDNAGTPIAVAENVVWSASC